MSVPMFIPAGGCYLLEKLKLMPQKRIPQAIVELALCGVGLYLGLLMAISCFPQEGAILRSKLEPELASKLQSEDAHAHYNKGL